MPGRPSISSRPAETITLTPLFSHSGSTPTRLNRGVSVIVSAGLLDMLGRPGIKYAETNMNLEDNYAIQNQWKRFDEEKIKLHRAYVKPL